MEWAHGASTLADVVVLPRVDVAALLPYAERALVPHPPYAQDCVRCGHLRELINRTRAALGRDPLPAVVEP